MFRDLFLGSVALAILYDQVFEVAAQGKTVQPILIFLVIFLFGSIPALRGDNKGNRPSTFARIIMAVMGVQFPETFEENEKNPPIGTESSTDGQTPHRGPSSEGSPPSSSRSSKQSPTKK